MVRLIDTEFKDMKQQYLAQGYEHAYYRSRNFRALAHIHDSFPQIRFGSLEWGKDITKGLDRAFVRIAKFFSLHVREDQKVGVTVGAETSFSREGLTFPYIANQSLVKNLTDSIGRQADPVAIVLGFPPENGNPSQVISVGVEDEKNYSIELSIHEDFETVPEDYFRTNLQHISDTSDKVDRIFRETLK
jgi:hypothetical protein